MAPRFAKVSEEEMKTTFFYPSDLVNTKTTIPLRVGEERWIYTSTPRVSVYIQYYLPPLRTVQFHGRELLRPYLNKNNQALYNPLVPINTNLFGDNLNKEVDDLTKANKVGLKVQASRKPRYHPCGRGLGARGRDRQNYAGRGRFCRRTNAFFKLGPGRMLLQTSQRETEVNTTISNLYGLTGGQVHNFVSKWMKLACDPQILEIIPLFHVHFGEIPTQKRWSALSNLKDFPIKKKLLSMI